MKYPPGDPRWKAHLNGVVAASGGKGSIATTRIPIAQQVVTNPGDHSRAPDGSQEGAESGANATNRLLQYLGRQDAAEANIDQAAKDSAASFVTDLAEACKAILAARVDSEEAGFPTRLQTALINAKIETVEVLVTKTRAELLGITGIGRWYVACIEHLLAEHGLGLAAKPTKRVRSGPSSCLNNT